MKNYEKYADELREYKYENFCSDFIKPNILKSDTCGDMSCDACRMLQMIWLFEEHKEPEVDWSKVAVDTPIFVSDDNKEWDARHFAKYEDGFIYSWIGGGTSWTSQGKMVEWRYAKLAEDEEE